MAQEFAGARATAPRFSVGRVLADTFKYLGRNFIAFIIISVVIAIPSLLIRTWAYGIPPAPLEGIFSDRNLASIFAGLIGLLTGALTQSALIYGTLQDMRGQKAGIGACISRGLSAMPKVAVAAILWSIVLGIGFMLLIIPGIIFAAIYWVYVPAIVIEGAGIMESFGRSGALTKGHRWGIFGLFMLLFVAFAILEFVAIRSIGTNVEALSSGFLLWALTAFGVVVSAFLAVLTAVGYYYLRAEKEGISIDEIARVFD